MLRPPVTNTISSPRHPYLHRHYLSTPAVTPPQPAHHLHSNHFTTTLPPHLVTTFNPTAITTTATLTIPSSPPPTPHRHQPPPKVPSQERFQLKLQMRSYEGPSEGSALSTDCTPTPYHQATLLTSSERMKKPRGDPAEPMPANGLETNK
ncbi:hypothetical protein Tco_0246036 [Tanacetum coccineum]